MTKIGEYIEWELESHVLLSSHVCIKEMLKWMFWNSNKYKETRNKSIKTQKASCCIDCISFQYFAKPLRKKLQKSLEVSSVMFRR